MKKDEIEIVAQMMFLYWAVFNIPPLHPSDGQNCDIGLEFKVLRWTMLHRESEIRERLKLLDKAVNGTPESRDVIMKEWAIGKEINTLKWVLSEGNPPPLF